MRMEKGRQEVVSRIFGNVDPPAFSPCLKGLGTNRLNRRHHNRAEVEVAEAEVAAPVRKAAPR